MRKCVWKTIAKVNHEVLAYYAEGRLEEGNQVARRLSKLEKKITEGNERR